jgi:hypothetical protein
LAAGVEAKVRLLAAHRRAKIVYGAAQEVMMFAALLCLSIASAQDPAAPDPAAPAAPAAPEAPATEAAPAVDAVGPADPSAADPAPAQATEAPTTDAGFTETTPPSADPTDPSAPSPALLRRRGVGMALTGVGITFAAGSLGFGIAGLLNQDGMGGAVLGAGGLIHVIPGAIFLGVGIPLWASADHQLGRSQVTLAPVVGPGNVGLQGRF